MTAMITGAGAIKQGTNERLGYFIFSLVVVVVVMERHEGGDMKVIVASSRQITKSGTLRKGVFVSNQGILQHACAVKSRNVPCDNC